MPPPKKPRMAAPRGHVWEAAALLGFFALIVLIRNRDSMSSPNFFIAQLHDCLSKPLRNSPNNIAQDAESHNTTQPRVALCLVGGARAFELTAEGILRHLIEGWEDTTPDVFLHAPLDADAHKLTLLGGNSAVHLASARIFRQETIPESALHRAVLYGGTSPNGVQGLLQYFHLVEGCLDMIARHERREGIRYDWVARTRVDGFWAGSVPPLSSLDASIYYVPVGSQFGGLNDRFGLGSRNATVAALSRVSLLPLLYSRGRRRLNSEAAFKAQLEEMRVPFETISLPFCILSRRRYSSWWGVPVASIGTAGALNGAKCRPCTPVAVGVEAERAVRKLSKRWAWPGCVRGLALCDGSGDWEENWEELYAAAAGRRFEKQRQRVLLRSSAECEADVVRSGKQWATWDAPPAEEICSRRHSG